MRELRINGRAQRTGGNDAPVADPAARVEHQHRKIFDERGIVEAVVHDDAFDAIARHDGWRGAREQKRLVADIARAVASRSQAPARSTKLSASFTSSAPRAASSAA